MKLFVETDYVSKVVLMMFIKLRDKEVQDAFGSFWRVIAMPYKWVPMISGK